MHIEARRATSDLTLLQHMHITYGTTAKSSDPANLERFGDIWSFSDQSAILCTQYCLQQMPLQPVMARFHGLQV